jgi:hypothetical protein
LDPGFVYFQNRSLDSIAEELKVRGYKAVSLTCTGGGKYPICDALAKHGINLPMDGTYLPSEGLPAGWQKWATVYRDPHYTPGDDFQYFCMNNPDFRKYKQQEIVDILLANPACTAVDMPECFVPGWGGPEAPGYGCLCDTCKKKFLEAYPEETEIPNFTDHSSPKYWKTNHQLYSKWVDFRVNTVVDLLDFVVNGPGGIRDRCPKVKVITWTSACQSIPGDAVAVEREWEALDGAAIVKRVRPDAHCIQTNWPDWSTAHLPSDYVRRYRPFVDCIRAVDPKLPLTCQTDSGSADDARRTFEWLDEFDKAAKDTGFVQTLDYQYHISADFYTKAPRLAEAKLSKSGSELRLLYDMFVDGKIASDMSNYKLSQGEVVSAKSDGNIVILGVSGVRPGNQVTVTKMGSNPAVLCVKGREQKIAGLATARVTAQKD